MQQPTFNSEAIAIRRFALRAAGFLVLQVLIAATVTWPFVRVAPDTYVAALNEKQHRLETIASPRLILVGSSNFALSFDSTMVKDRLGLEPVNMGLHQGLGLQFVLNDTARFVRPGDVMLVSVEYSHYRADLTSDIIVESLIAAPHATVQGLDLRLFQKLADQVVPLLGRRTRTLALSAVGRMKLTPEHPYRHDSFNELGDNIAHLGMGPHPNRERGIPFRYSDRVDHVIERLNDFARTCRDRGARVYYSHPPYPQFEYSRDEQDVKRLHEALVKHLVFPVISEPSETVYPDDEFYDMEYHTLGEGRNHRTELVLNRLQEPLIKDRSGK